MGEIIMFPGSPGRGSDDETVTIEGPGKIISIADRRKKPSPPPPLLGGLNQIIRRIMEVVPKGKREELARIIGEVGIEETSGRRNRHMVRDAIEERWWEAHKQGDLEGQTRIEEEIGSRYDTGRAGKIIARLRTIAQFYEAQNQPKNP